MDQNSVQIPASTTTAPPHVYQAICDVMGDLSEIGIGKEQKNAQQGFMYRGIDDVYNALSRILTKRGLCVLPRVKSRTMETRTTGQNKAIYYVFLEVEFDLVASRDGSKHTIASFGEAMDMADKATNKAMSAAYKYACFQAFCIPVDVLDPDATTPPDTLPPGQKPQQSSKQSTSKPAGAPPQREKMEKLTVPQIADLAVRADAIADYQTGRNIAAELYNAYLGGAIQASNTREIAISIVGKLTDLVTATDYPKLEGLVNSFTNEKFFTDQERTVFLSSTRSRLNIPSPTNNSAQ